MEVASVILSLESGVTSVLRTILLSFPPRNDILPKNFLQSTKDINSFDKRWLNHLGSGRHYTKVYFPLYFQDCSPQQWRHGGLWSGVLLCFWGWLCQHRLQQNRTSSSS